MPAILLMMFLLAAHLLADLWLQPDRLAQAKRRHGIKGVLALGLHSSIHGTLTGLVLLSPQAFLLEALAHSLIDRGKCNGYYGTWPDQAAHVLAKIAWLIVFGTEASLCWRSILAMRPGP